MWILHAVAHTRACSEMSVNIISEPWHEADGDVVKKPTPCGGEERFLAKRGNPSWRIKFFRWEPHDHVGIRKQKNLISAGILPPGRDTMFDACYA